MAELIKLYEKNPSERLIEHIVDVLKDGGLIIYPTDTVYAIGCDIFHNQAMLRLAQLKKTKADKAHFSIVCSDLSHLSEYTKPISTHQFRILKRNLPGPFTFILPANTQLPNLYKNKKTIGIRVPDHSIPRLIVEKLGHPISTTSTHDDDEILEYTTDPELIAEKYDKLVDIVIDAGIGGLYPSTIVDLTTEEPEIIRQGKGELILV